VLYKNVRPDDVYVVELVEPYTKNDKIWYCPSTGPSYIWKEAFKDPFSYNETSYIFNMMCIDVNSCQPNVQAKPGFFAGKSLGSFLAPAEAPLFYDMPYMIPGAPHSSLFNVAYLDGHAKAVRMKENAAWVYFVEHSCSGWIRQPVR
jgi:prepilin-type processing-associated H-X9-DG protein